MTLSVEFEAAVDAHVAAQVERRVHAILAERRVRGEWFDVSASQAATHILAAIAECMQDDGVPNEPPRSAARGPRSRMGEQTMTDGDFPPRGLPRMHPGRLLREIVLPALKDAGYAKQAVAEQLGVTRQSLENIVTEKSAITAEMALRLGKLCGNGPELWFRLQHSWDLEQAETAMAAEIARIPTLRVDEAA